MVCISIWGLSTTFQQRWHQCLIEGSGSCKPSFWWQASTTWRVGWAVSSASWIILANHVLDILCRCSYIWSERQWHAGTLRSKQTIASLMKMEQIEHLCEGLFDPLSEICELHMPGLLLALDSHQAISTSNQFGCFHSYSLASVVQCDIRWKLKAKSKLFMDTRKIIVISQKAIPTKHPPWCLDQHRHVGIPLFHASPPIIKLFQ